ncbi:hypothetical protein GLYMA_20G030200v4 [Glycine max]|uniref:Uncharacterized protein n=1 Tax=Glycine max TaxID=3847 RepID=K7N135_SOYBN|nr:hypothetical protein JHK87_055172 [Glycine soja]KAG4917627.1 hypothetical protein JHK85_055908 [Glycine max]KAH1034301.1 hypothetical protein GYH30_054623 [Glycine max]KRG89541.1 hypothetical protein GLYMA_20G030200v4 [Glycine max]
MTYMYRIGFLVFVQISNSYMFPSTNHQYFWMSIFVPPNCCRVTKHNVVCLYPQPQAG